MNYCEPQRRFEASISAIRQDYPMPGQILGERRQALHAVLQSYADGGKVHCYLVENDHVVPLPPEHHFGDFGRPKIWQLDTTQNFSANHYLPTYLALLRKLEQTEAHVQPGRTIMLEVTTGSAGVAFGHVGQLLGYPRELFTPKEIQENDPARFALMQEAVEGNDACGGRLIAAEGGHFLASAIHSFRERISALGGHRGRERGLFALPNHSLKDETVIACTRAFRKLLDSVKVPMDAAIVGLGNGTSAVALRQACAEKFGVPPDLFGFEGKHDPGVWQKLHGRLPPEEREDRVWMYGVDGTGNIEMDFRFIEQLLADKALRNVVLVSRQECENVFERLNRGQEWQRTMGRTSAAGLAVAANIAREGGYRNVCSVRYDTAVPYGRFIPWASNPVDGPTTYRGMGEWSKQITAEQFVAGRRVQ